MWLLLQKTQLKCQFGAILNYPPESTAVIMRWHEYGKAGFTYQASGESSELASPAICYYGGLWKPTIQLRRTRIYPEPNGLGRVLEVEPRREPVTLHPLS